MKQKCLKYIIAGIPILFAPLTALADSSDRPKPSIWLTVFFTILPFALAGIFIYYIIRKVQRPRVKEYETYRIRHEQHMDRVEQSLERIVKALEERK